MSGADSYDRDFMEWSDKDAGLLRAGRYAEADIDHIAEEIEDMGRAGGTLWPAACVC